MTPWIRTLLASLIALATVAFFWMKLEGLTDTAVSNQRAASVNEQRLETAEQQVSALAEQLRSLGERPVVEPEDVPEPVTPEPLVGPPGLPGVPGPQGEPGRAPSPAEIAAAVSAYCAGGRCDGQDATTGQVRAAVLEYCNARGECRGPAGAAGSPGTDGADGSDGATGPQGPPPSDEQVAQAVATYCSSRNECRGPQGPAGERGPAGPAGQPAYPFTFTFTVQQNPAQSTTYTVSCEVAGEPCTVATQDEATGS